MSGVCPYCSPPYLTRQGLLLNSGRQFDQLALEILLFVSEQTRITMCIIMPHSFFLSFKNLFIMTEKFWTDSFFLKNQHSHSQNISITLS